MVVTKKIKTNKSKQTKPIEANWILEMILLIDRRWGNLLSHCLWHWLRFCGLFSITNNWLVIQSITKFGFWKIQMECISISCGFAKERTKKAIIDNLSCIIHQQLHIVRNPRFKWRSFTINPIHKWNKEFPQSVNWRSFATKKKSHANNYRVSNLNVHIEINKSDQVSRTQKFCNFDSVRNAFRKYFAEDQRQ